MSEDEIGQEFDRVIRAAMMGLGQVREGLARRSSARSQAERDAAALVTKQQESVTQRVLAAVNRESFWDAANGERIANAATYGATLYNTDQNAAAVYDIVRDNTWSRFGINVDQLRAAHPDDESDRRNALIHAVDDRIAANREGALAREDRAQSADFASDAEAARESAGKALGEDATPAEVQDLQHDGERLQDAADASLADAQGHEGERDRYASREASENVVAARAGQPATAGAAAAVKTRQQVSASYPTNAKAALAQSRSGRQPNARGGRRGAQQGRPRTSGLGR